MYAPQSKKLVIMRILEILKRYTFRAQRMILNDVMDWFGRELRLFNKHDDTVDIAVTINREAMLCWAMQYGRYVEVLTPDDLRVELLEAFSDAVRRYG